VRRAEKSRKAFLQAVKYSRGRDVFLSGAEKCLSQFCKKYAVKKCFFARETSAKPLFQGCKTAAPAAKRQFVRFFHRQRLSAVHAVSLFSYFNWIHTKQTAERCVFARRGAGSKTALFPRVAEKKAEKMCRNAQGCAFLHRKAHAGPAGGGKKVSFLLEKKRHVF